MFNMRKGNAMPKPQENGPPPPERPPQFQDAINHLNAAGAHLSEAMDVLSRIGFGLQRGADYILKYRDNLVNAIEAAGGQVEVGSVEEEIREFLPRRLREEQQRRDYQPPQHQDAQENA
jgi:hypothetical protein